MRTLWQACWLFTAVLLGGFVQAQEPIRGHPDVRLLIDVSGSMKQSDPNNLRAPALELIVRLLPPGSKAGVWLFGDGVRTLLPHVVIDDAWRDKAVQSVRAIDNSGQRTNIPAAIEAALYDINRLDPDFRTSVVLLTDGKVDVASSAVANANAARLLLEEQAPILGQTGVPVHTIALSNEADWAFLRKLAESTQGLAEKAESADSLTRVFLQALEMVAPTARVPIEGGEFQIDDGVSQLTALIFSAADQRANVELIDPDNAAIDPNSAHKGVRWFNNEKFSLVTVDSPKAGRWRLVAPSSEENRITVISDLSIDVDPLPNSLPVDQPTELGLRLVDREGVITSPDLLEVFSIKVMIIDPSNNTEVIDVRALYSAPSKGEYRITMPAFSKPGLHKITVRVEADTLVRELPMYVDVQVPPEAPKVITKVVETQPVSALPVWLLPGIAGLVGLSLLLWAVRSWREANRKRRIAAARKAQESRDAPLMEMRVDSDENDSV